MKIIVLLLCVASYAVVRADDAPSSCLEKAGITMAELPELVRDTSPEGTRRRGCLEACAMQKMGLMKGNIIDMEKLDEHIDNVVDDSEKRERVRQSVHQCATEAANDDECVVAQNFAKCGLDRLKVRLQQFMKENPSS